MNAERYSRALAGAAAGGGLLGLADVTVYLARVADGLSGGDTARLLGWGAVSGLAAGLVLGGVLGLVLHGGRSRVWAVVLGLGGVAAAALDAFAYRNLYPEIHAVLGGCALVGFAGAGAVLGRRRWLLGPAVVAAAGLTFLMPWLVGDGHRLRQVALQEGTLSARVMSLLPGPEEGVSGAACEWPEAIPLEAGPSVADSALLVTIDAMRADLGSFEQVLPRTAARLPHAVEFKRAYAPATATVRSSYAFLTGRWIHNLRFDYAGVTEDDRFFVLAPDDLRVTDPQRWKQRHAIPINDRTPTLPALLPRFESLAVVPFVYLLPEAGVTRDFTTVDATPYKKHHQDSLSGISAHTTTRIAKEWLASRRGRWFLWAHYLDPHHPYIGLQNMPADAPDRVRYLGEIRRTDAAVAKLLEVVDLTRTIVIITADHGEEFGDHGGRHHGTTVYEEQLRVPLWIAYPGSEPRTISTPVSLIDLTPTLLDLLGQSAPGPFDGRSLRHPATKRPLLGESERGGRKVAVISGKDKLVVDFTKQTQARYDIQTDPGERQNLVDTNPPKTNHLRCLLQAANAQQ